MLYQLSYWPSLTSLTGVREEGRGVRGEGNSAGDLTLSIRGGVVVPATLHYQTWYRNSASFCTPSPFNLTNGVTVSWVP